MTISRNDVYEHFQNPKPSKTPYTEADRITHFYKLMLVMQVEGKTDNVELGTLINFGLKTGIRPVVADQILKKMDLYENGIVPADELLNIFKVYYN